MIPTRQQLQNTTVTMWILSLLLLFQSMVGAVNGHVTTPTSTTTTTTASSSTQPKEKQPRIRFLQDDSNNGEPPPLTDDALQQLVSQLVLQLPDMSTTEEIFGSDLDLVITNVQCSEIFVGDLEVSSESNNKNKDSSVNTLLTTSISELDLVCTLDYEFEYVLFIIKTSGKGSARITMQENSMSATLEFFDTLDNEATADGVPSNVTLNECSANFVVADIEFYNSQGVSADLLNNLDGFVRGFIEDEIGNIICTDLGSILHESVSDLLTSFSTTLQPYVYERDQSIISTATERLSTQSATTMTAALDGVTLIQFQKQDSIEPVQDISGLWNALSTNNNETSWLTTLMAQLAALGLGDVWTATSGDNIFGIPVEPDTIDLGINYVLREYILEDDGAFTLDSEQLSTLLDGVLGDDEEENPFLVSTEGDDDDEEGNGLGVNAKISLDSMSLYGLDSFRKFVLMDASNEQQYTLNNDFGLEYLRLEIDVTMDVKSAPKEDEDSMILDPNNAMETMLSQQQMKLSIQLDKVDATMLLLLAIDQTKFGQLKVGSLLYNTSSFTDCFVSSIFESELSALQVTVGNIQDPTLVGGFIDQSPLLTEALKQAIMAGMSMYKDPILRAIPNLFQDRIRGVINDKFFQNNIKKMENEMITCPDLPHTGNTWLDFRDLLLDSPASQRLGGSGLEPYGSLVPSVAELIKSQMVASTDLLPSLIASVTGGNQSDDGNSIYYTEDLASGNTRLWLGDLDARISYAIVDARIMNIDTLGGGDGEGDDKDIQLLEPVAIDPSLLNNSASIGTPRPLRIGGRLILRVETEDTLIKNDMDISADFHDLSLALTTLIRVMEDGYASFPLSDLFNLDCWLATIPPPSLDEFGLRQDGVEPHAAVERILVSMKSLNMKMKCLDCTSPGIRQLEELWSDPVVTAEMTSTVSDLVSSTSMFLADGFLQLEIDRMLNEASKKCPHSPQYDPNFNSLTFQQYRAETTEDDAATFAMIMIIVIVFLIVFLVVGFYLLRFFVRQRHSKWLNTLPDEQLATLANRQKEDEKKEAGLNKLSRSMFASEDDIPAFVRYLIPVIILGNIALFLSGHLSVAAEVGIILQFAGQEIRVEEVYAFSMARSAVEIWNAGAHLLAMGILVFSGIWPYTKQLISLSLWFLPPARCSISRRGSILLWLDFLAKWSIVDIFTLVMTVAAFRLSIQSPVTGFLPEKLYSADLLIATAWGLYANLLAQLISQISSHFIIHYHRSIVRNATKAYRQENGLVPKPLSLPPQDAQDSATESEQSWDSYGERKDRLCETKFSRRNRAEPETLVVPQYVNGGIVLAAVLIFVFIIVGCILPSVGLEFFGILGVAVEIGQDGEPALQELSTFGLLGIMMDQAAFIGTARAYLGLGLLCFVLVCTVLVVPLIQTLVLLYHWFVPMSVKSRKRICVALECLQAWQYAEVYILSVIVASWQLGSISTHLFNSYCEYAKDQLNMLAYFGAIGENDAQCFRTNASILTGCYFMFVGALLLAVLNTFVVKATTQYLRARDEENNQSNGWKQQKDTPMTERSSPVFSSFDGNKSDKEIESEVEEGNVNGEGSTCQREETLNYIKPTQVFFTDIFRWTLSRDN